MLGSSKAGPGISQVGSGSNKVGPDSNEVGLGSSEVGLRVEFSRTDGSQGNSSISILPCPGHVLAGLLTTSILQPTLKTAKPVLWQYPLFYYGSQDLDP